MRRRFPFALAIALTATIVSATLVARPAQAGANLRSGDVATSAAVATAATAAATPPPPAQAEAEFVARINSLRAARGLGSLTVDGELTAASRSWASVMAGEGRIFHSSNLAQGLSTRWAKLGENVGVGGELASLFDAFVASPSHLENLVDPAYTHVGVGVVVSGNRMFTTHRFMAVQPTPPPPPPAPAAPPTSEPAAAPAPPPPAPSTTALPPSTTSTTTAPTTTTEPPQPPSKLGPIDRLSELVSS